MKAYALNSRSARLQTRWERFVARRLPTVVMCMMVGTLILAVLYPYVVVTVPTGHVGVLWKRLGGFGVYCWCVVNRGTVLDPLELRDEGLHVIWPWDRLYLYDLRLQTATQTYNAISRDGVSLTATISVRFQLKHNSVAQLHKFIGPDYMELVVRPEIGSRAREIISKYSAEQVYSSRQSIEDAIRESAQIKLGEELDRLVQPEASDQFQALHQKPVFPQLRRAIDILDTLVLGISLPEAVMTAINRKIEQLYVAQEYEYRVIREGRESERKRIEAAGIRDFQQIVSQGISDSYLRWRGIEATLQLAQSGNAKTVIIGSNKDGLPIILGNADAAAPSPVPAGGGASPAGMTTQPSSAAAAAPAGDVAGLSEHTPSTTNPSSMSTPSTNLAPRVLAAPQQPQSAFPHSWSDLRGMLFQPPQGAATTKPDQPPVEPSR